MPPSFSPALCQHECAITSAFRFWHSYRRISARGNWTGGLNRSGHRPVWQRSSRARRMRRSAFCGRAMSADFSGTAVLWHHNSTAQAMLQSVGSRQKRQVLQMFACIETVAADQNQRPRPYQPPPPSTAMTRTMIRIVIKSINFSPVGALAATAARDEQSILHDWHSTEH